MPDVPQAVQDLIRKFADNADHYRSPAYNETQCRIDFINPLFEVLGWDMANRAGYADAYRDVIHEDAIKVGGATKAPDYGFRIGGARKFFLEAKKPGVKIKTDAEPAYQLRRYAWSAKLRLSILTDFEEFAIYDCRIKPDKDDKSSVGRIFYCTWEEYPEKWEHIASIFSRESVLKGSFDRFAEATRGKRGTAEVDAAFLKEIETWREALARGFALRNPELSQRDLNFAVQRTIDRLIFLRICEDRAIELYGQLQSLVNGDKVYERLNTIFRRADEKYNSGIFHFEFEKDRAEPPDDLTLSLRIDDKVLKEIIRSLYYPDSPYEFSVLPADILGQVYEQFLGKVIRLTSGHRAVIEEKPEVRKAGGVYYTPTYIVDYIVRNTVGRLLGDDGTAPGSDARVEAAATAVTPKEAAKLRILDPACGSGSFMIGAYQYLLEWHLRWYLANDPENWAKGKNPAVYRVVRGAELRPQGRGQSTDWRLTTAERKRILLNNIYGVDIDPQAVEVTKLSLLLKVLEGESGEVLNNQWRLLHERALPDLGRNIKCGNSLIGPDFYNGQQINMFDEEERLRVNVFDWPHEFSNILQSPSRKAVASAGAGFDAVIGNPPYIRIQRLSHAEIDYIFRSYRTPTSKLDLSLMFLEKALKLSTASGLAGFICTSQWLSAKYGEKMRLLLSKGHVREIVDFGSLPVFRGADTYPAIFVLSPSTQDEFRYKRVTDVNHLSLSGIAHTGCLQVSRSRLSGEPWSFGAFDVAQLLSERKIPWKPLAHFGKAYIGTKTGLNEAFVLDRAEAKRLRLESALLLPYAYSGGEIGRYRDIKPSAVVIYPYREGEKGTPVLIPENLLREKHPRVHAYLHRHKAKLQRRRDSRRAYGIGSSWYRHLRAGSFEQIKTSKLVMKGVANSSCAGLLGPRTAFDGARCPAFVPRDPTDLISYYFLGLLNCRLATYHYRRVCPPKLGGYVEFTARGIPTLPIPVQHGSLEDMHSMPRRIIALVGQMLALQNELANSKTAHVKEATQRQIDATDRQIDQAVYQLYGLTDDEIRIVEEATLISRGKTDKPQHV